MIIRFALLVVVALVLGRASNGFGQGVADPPAPLCCRPLAFNFALGGFFAGLGSYADTDSCWKQWWHSSCDMLPHVTTPNPDSGTYYFRPYHVSDVSSIQRFAAQWGGDPRNPYSGEVFAAIHRQFGEDSESRQEELPGLLPLPEPEAMDSESSPELEPAR